MENIVNNFAANGGKGKHKTLATLTNGGRGGRVLLTERKDAKMKENYHWESFGGKENLLQERFRPSEDRRARNIDEFSSLGDPSTNRDNGGDEFTEDGSVVDGDDPMSCILPLREMENLVGENLMCGMCVEGEKKLFEDKLINAIPFKYHDDVHSVVYFPQGDMDNARGGGAPRV